MEDKDDRLTDIFYDELDCRFKHYCAHDMKFLIESNNSNVGMEKILLPTIEEEST